jgi:hypothetical protein
MDFTIKTFNLIGITIFAENDCQGAGCGPPQGPLIGSGGGSVDGEVKYGDCVSFSGGKYAYCILSGSSSPDRECPPGQQTAPHKGSRCVKSATSS